MGAILAWVIFVLAVTLPSFDGKKVCFQVQGLIAPVFTPVDDNGRLNTEIVLPYAQYLADQGVDGVLVAGTAGEGPTLNVTDKKNLITAWVEAAQRLKLSVTIQVGGIPLPDAQELAAFSQEAGADAILTLPELYYKPKTAKSLVFFLQEVARFAPDTPVLYYHIPKYTHVNVNMVEFVQLASERVANFKGLKSEDYGTSLLLQNELTRDQKIFIATDALYLLSAVCVGFENFIMTEINFWPDLVKKTVYYGTRGYCKKAKPFYRRLRRLMSVMTKDEEGNELATMKEAIPLVTGIKVGPIRPPEIRLSFEEAIRLEIRFQEAQIEIIDSVFDDE